MAEPSATTSPSGAMPVTVVGGYLGAGKTTLLNHLLRTTTEPLAVLINDFGEINVDADLIESHDGETMTLTNGCICCSMTDGLAQALADVVALNPRPARLIIEASGVADPASVAGYCHRPGLMLDAVVVLVDAETLDDRLADRRVGDLVRGQLRAGDIVVVNKLDLIDDPAVAESTVRQFNDDGLLIGTQDSNIAPELLFGASTAGGLEPESPGSREPELTSWTWSSEQPVSRAWIEALMDRIPSDVHRLKGIVRLDGDDRKLWALQRVGSRWALRPVSKTVDGAISSLIAIGHPDSTFRFD